MNRKKVIRDCIGLFIICLTVAIGNTKWYYFIIPDQENMIDTQLNLFTICSVFAGFSFSLLGLIMGVFSEKIIVKLKGSTLIQRKCNCIVKGIIYFCISGFVSIIFMLGFNVYISKIAGNKELVNNVLYVSGIGFLLFGMVYFMKAVKSLFLIIEKIYGFNNQSFNETTKRYHAAKENLFKKREVQENENGNI